MPSSPWSTNKIIHYQENWEANMSDTQIHQQYLVSLESNISPLQLLFGLCILCSRRLMFQQKCCFSALKSLSFLTANPIGNGYSYKFSFHFFRWHFAVPFPPNFAQGFGIILLSFFFSCQPCLSCHDFYSPWKL